MTKRYTDHESNLTCLQVEATTNSMSQTSVCNVQLMHGEAILDCELREHTMSPDVTFKYALNLQHRNKENVGTALEAFGKT